MSLRSSVLRATASAFLAVALAGPALAARTVNEFPATVQQDGASLTLNGKGTRHRAILNVYDMALYLPRKVKTREELLALPGPKRIEFIALRDLKTDDVGRAFVQGIRENATREQSNRHLVTMAKLIEVASMRDKINKGEGFSVHYTPGKGTVFSIAGQPQGPALGDEEFFKMVLDIWVGFSPAEPLLKDALLGE